MSPKEIIKSVGIPKEPAKYLYLHYLNKTELDYINNVPLTLKEIKKYKNAVNKLIKGANIYHIIGHTQFFNHKILVNKDVLIPRSETEELVNKTINYLKEYNINPKSIIDLGTGSGAIAITLSNLYKKSKVIALDISKKALRVAKKNNQLNNTSVIFSKQNILKPLEGTYDLIISNPPYLNKKAEDNVHNTEPHLALYANNLEFYEAMLAYLPNNINTPSIIAFEMGYDQGTDLKKLSKTHFPNSKIILEPDYNNQDRYLFIISE